MKLDIDLLTRLEAEATGGNWWHQPERYSSKNIIRVGRDDRWLIHCQPEFNGAGNAEFIAAMRNAMPHILKRLRAADALREGVEHAWHNQDCTRNECELCAVVAKYDKDISHE